MSLTVLQRAELRRRCTTVVPGYPSLNAAEEFAALADWCRAREVQGDSYGQGGLLAEFEQQIATLLGKPAACFMPSGVMAQLIAVRLHTERARLGRFGLSPNSHLALHEEQAFESLWGLHGVSVGSRLRPIVAADLQAVAQPLACLLVELPMREIGGQLPSWDELSQLQALAAERGLPLHLDGARLWQCRSFYEQRSFAEIVVGFASVYVSFYKDIGGLSGAMLAGDADFIAQARLWLRRMGGNLVQQTAPAASALMRLEQRLAVQDACYQRTLNLVEGPQGLNSIAGLRLNPARPHTSMLHLHFDAAADAINDARDALAQAEGCWLIGNARLSEVPGWSYAELTVGEHLLGLDNARVRVWMETLLMQAQGRVG